MSKLKHRLGQMAFAAAGLVILLLCFAAWDWWSHGGPSASRASSGGQGSTGALEIEDGDEAGPGWHHSYRELSPVPLIAVDDACSLGETARLVLRGDVGYREDAEPGTDGVAPTCYYTGRLVGRGPECLVEFPLGTADTYSTHGFGADLANRYYRRTWHRLLYFAPLKAPASEPPIFLMMDDRWCRWFGAAEGFRLGD